MQKHLLICILVLGTHVAQAAASEPAPAKPETTTAAERTVADSVAPGKQSLQLSDLAGERRRPLEVGKNKAAVIIFVLHDCPISNKYAPEIQRLASEFAPQKIPFVVVHVDPGLADDDARQHAKQYGYKLPVLIDRKHELVHVLKATTAPEAFVIGPEAKVLYRGRIDDRYVAVGKARQQVQRQDLRLALSAIVEGKRIEVAETKAIGCYIPELEKD